MNSDTRAPGLPSGPGRARSRSRHEPDRQIRHDRAPSLPRSVRPQKSVPSIPKERSNVSSTPRDRPSASSHSHRSPAPSYRSSSESSFSSRSTFDHVRSRSGYTSSVTSYEDEELRRTTASPPPTKEPSLRHRREPQRSPERQSEQALPSISSDGGLGSSIWNRVAVAAGALSINVSKAWAANIVTMSGEETPPGQDSRLTRAMKAYHLAKARELSDLPSWLFEEHERMPKRDNVEGPSTRTTHTESSRSVTRSNGLRDIYDSASVPVASTRPSAPSLRYNQPDVQPSKATDRLKAMRDAKRTALQSQTSNTHQVDTVRRSGDSFEQPQPAPRRVGLPSGPATVSRRGNS